MSVSSSSKLWSGFLVNHFGGRPSAAIPEPRSPFRSILTRTKACGSAVSVAMPYLKGILVRMFRM